jgi:hypothetical protein
VAAAARSHDMTFGAILLGGSDAVLRREAVVQRTTAESSMARRGEAEAAGIESGSAASQRPDPRRHPGAQDDELSRLVTSQIQT